MFGREREEEEKKPENFKWNVALGEKNQVYLFSPYIDCNQMILSFTVPIYSHLEPNINSQISLTSLQFSWLITSNKDFSREQFPSGFLSYIIEPEAKETMAQRSIQICIKH